MELKVIVQSTFVSLYEVLAGGLLALLLSVTIVIAAYSNKLFYRIIRPFLFISQTIPIVVIAPIIVMVLGFGILPKVVIVALNCFFPICISLLNGIKSADADKINLLKTMGASKNQVLRYVLLPSSRSHFFSGLKISATYAVISAVIGEWLGGDFGIGIYMIRAKKSYAADKLIISTILVCVLTVILTMTVTLIEKKHLGKISLTIACTALLFTSIPFIINRPKPGTERIDFVLDYTPNTNHTGIYVAKELGYFAEEGLDVNIKQPPQDGASTLIISGKAQFGIDFQDQLVPILENEDLSKRIKVLATILQHNTAVILSKEESNITTVSDLTDKTFAVSSNPIEQTIINLLLKNSSTPRFISTDETDVISTLKNGIDAMSSYYGWDVIAAKANNMKVNHIFYRDIDNALDFYTPVIVSNSDYVTKNPESTKKFMKSISKGYAYASRHPIESAEILCKSAPGLDKTLVVESQKYLSREYICETGVWGHIDKDRWNRFYNWLYENHVIDAKIHERDVVCDGYL